MNDRDRKRLSVIKGLVEAGGIQDTFQKLSKHFSLSIADKYKAIISIAKGSLHIKYGNGKTKEMTLFKVKGGKDDHSFTLNPRNIAECREAVVKDLTMWQNMTFGYDTVFHDVGDKKCYKREDGSKMYVYAYNIAVLGTPLCAFKVDAKTKTVLVCNCYVVARAREDDGGKLNIFFDYDPQLTSAMNHVNIKAINEGKTIITADNFLDIIYQSGRLINEVQEVKADGSIITHSGAGIDRKDTLHPVNLLNNIISGITVSCDQKLLLDMNNVTPTMSSIMNMTNH